jgi:hypothetical protein
LEVIVHTFKLMDVEDPDLYAAQPIIEFEQSEKGKWVLEHSIDIPVWKRISDFSEWGYTYKITAELEGASLTEWMLRYGSS